MIAADQLTLHVNNTVLLECISFALSKGQMLGVVGPAGSGKSILLKSLAGLCRLDLGTVCLDGVLYDHDDMLSSAWRTHVGMSFQNDALWDDKTVLDNVMYPLQKRGVADAQQKACDVLERVGLLSSCHKYPHELSGGMRKRVGVARAVIAAPQVGLFDDPTAGLDPHTAVAIFDMLRDFVLQQQMVSLVVSSDVQSLLPCVDHLLVLDKGRVVFSGTKHEAMTNEHPLVYAFVRGTQKDKNPTQSVA